MLVIRTKVFARTLVLQNLKIPLHPNTAQEQEDFLSKHSFSCTTGNRRLWPQTLKMIHSFMVLLFKYLYVVSDTMSSAEEKH